MLHYKHLPGSQRLPLHELLVELPVEGVLVKTLSANSLVCMANGQGQRSFPLVTFRFIVTMVDECSTVAASATK